MLHRSGLDIIQPLSPLLFIETKNGSNEVIIISKADFDLKTDVPQHFHDIVLKIDNMLDADLAVSIKENMEELIACTMAHDILCSLNYKASFMCLQFCRMCITLFSMCPSALGKWIMMARHL